MVLRSPSMSDEEPTIDVLEIQPIFIKKLKDVGIRYLKELSIFTFSELMEILGTDDDTVMRILLKASELLEKLKPDDYGTITLEELMKMEKKKQPTG